MKKILLLILSMMTMFLLTACGVAENTDDAVQKAESQDAETAVAAAKAGSKILVVYYSRTGENYEVGNIAKGNTHIVADMIAEKTGADMFEIKTVNAYPADYRACTDVAKQELQDNARPAYVGSVANFDAYDTIFLGYPIWWSDLPMVVYTFLESNNFSGKTIIPFCTSAGSYMTGKESAIPEHAKGATMREGLGLKGKRCQDSPDSVRADVNQWLGGLGY